MSHDGAMTMLSICLSFPAAQPRPMAANQGVATQACDEAFHVELVCVPWWCGGVPVPIPSRSGWAVVS